MSRVPLGKYWALLAVYLRPLWKRVALLAALMIATIGLQVANPQIIRYVLDTARGAGDLQPLLLAGLVFLISSVLMQVATVASTYVSEDVGWTATNRLRADLALHCMRLDQAFHNERTPGEMIERIDGDVANLAIFFSQFVVRVLGSLLLLAGVLLALLREDWRISLALAAYAGLALFVLSRMQRFAEPRWKAAREASAQLFGFLEEQLAGTEDIRSSGAAAFAMRNLFRLGRARLQAERRAGVANTFFVMTWLGLFTLGQIVAYTGGYYLHQDGLLTLGAVYLILYYTDAIYRPLEQITEQIQNLQKAGASIDRVNELYHTASALPEGDRELPAGPLGVTFDAVGFSYEAAHAAARPTTDDRQPTTNDLDSETAAELEQDAVVDGDRSSFVVGRSSGTRLVLDDISFSLAPGEVLGLLGRTGSGKTTVTRLLFRLYEPTQGAIYLGDGRLVDLRETRLEDLRRRVGMVTQDVQLFRASVRDNLTFFDRTIGDERILAALEELGMGEWLRGLPDELDTVLAGGSAGLSAGEAQLLAFTRVFLKDPGLVILDEASSRLDPATEQRIERAIDRLLAGRTGIIVAHRLATVHRADHIMILEEGRVREFGAYDALVRDPDSRFAQLLRTGEMQEVLAG
ncbi:MAG TPA: ABC transporter ATP-binding protein [Roseiflexaceae bacterium]|nr:ABC transporter ATP-binding protein [Roseiflexaceae bacterium]